MLSTLIIHVYNKCGQVQECSAVLDSGLQLNFISKACVDKLGLPQCSNALNINRVGSMSLMST